MYKKMYQDGKRKKEKEGVEKRKREERGGEGKKQ